MYLSKKFFLVSVVTHFVPHPPAAIEGSSDPTISVATSCLASIGHYTTTIIPQSLPGQYCNWKERYIKKKKITEFKKGGKCIFKNKTGTRNMVLFVRKAILSFLLNSVQTFTRKAIQDRFRVLLYNIGY